MKNNELLFVGQRIKATRERLRITQTELAERLGTTQQVVSHFEKDDKGNLSLARIVEITEALGADLDEVLGIANAPIHANNNTITNANVGIGSNGATFTYTEVPSKKEMEACYQLIYQLQNEVAHLREFVLKLIDK